jgi:AraC-like DNA-binding protein
LLSGIAPVTIRLHASCRVTAIRLPADSLATTSRQIDGRAFALLSRAAPAFSFLVRNVKLLRAEAPAGDPVLIRRAANYLSELVTLALEPSAPRCAEVRRKSRLTPIIDDILSNLSKPGLSAKTVAKRHGITDRYVHLLFKQSGQTFSRFVQEERLKRAHALLSNPDLNWMRISEIAFECGFGDLSTFNRSFRDRYGNHPKGIRASFATRAVGPKAAVADPVRTRNDPSYGVMQVL